MTAAVLFYVFSAFAVIFALAVILLRNPVLSALSLVASFFGVSAIFVLLHAPFLGVMQILIYVGAILVLFLYVTMLLNLRKSGAFTTRDRKLRVAGLVALPLLVSFLWLVVDVPGGEGAGVPETFGSLATVGVILLQPQVLVFEMISLVLLAAIIGAVVLSGGRKGDAA